MEEPTMRLRGNFTTTTKGVFTVDVTCEISNIELSPDKMDIAQDLINANLSKLHDEVKKVALSKGYVEAAIEQK